MLCFFWKSAEMASGTVLDTAGPSEPVFGAWVFDCSRWSTVALHNGEAHLDTFTSAWNINGLYF